MTVVKGPDERPTEAPVQRTATVVVPHELVQALAGLVEVYAQLGQLSKQLDAAATQAKSIRAVHGLSAVRELQSAGLRVAAPIMRAIERLFPPDEGVGAIPPPHEFSFFGKKMKTRTPSPLDLAPGASFLILGEEAAVRIVAAVGVREAVANTNAVAAESQVAAKGALALLRKFIARGTLPVAVTAGLAAGFSNCAKVTGGAIGILAGLKLFGSKFGRQALRDAAPVLLAVGAALFILRKKGR